MPAQKESKTKYPGVFYIEGQGARGPERIFYIRYRRRGKLIVEKAGRQFQDDMTPARAAGVRARRIEGKEASNREQRAAERAVKEVEGGKYTMSRLWKLYQKSGRALKSRGGDESRYNCYIGPAFGDKEPQEILKLDIERLKQKYLSGKSPQTIKLSLALLRRLVNYGIENNVSGPMTFKIEMPKVNNEVIETLTKNQMTKLLAVLKNSDDIQGSRLMMLALYTGMRRGELLNLKWMDVDLEAGFIRIREPKGKKDVSIPLNQSARDTLENHPVLGDYVFVNRKNKPFRDIRKRVDKLRKAADLPAGFRPIHGLRHVFATTLANSGQVDIYTLQRLLTHRDVKTTSRYAHLLDQRLQDATAVMDSAMSDM